MRRSGAEKMEMIRLVEHSESFGASHPAASWGSRRAPSTVGTSATWTGVPRRWRTTSLERGRAGTGSRRRSASRSSIWP